MPTKGGASYDLHSSFLRPPVSIKQRGAKAPNASPKSAPSHPRPYGPAEGRQTDPWLGQRTQTPRTRSSTGH
ncbi:hypothetical protein SKAU_G00259260 [Synaphobranchus kaupii]|uniref:Uncharacterized protein n=1 Tax=Synaphobranchus kaupii TaxID=118154 RepID=A0A9Q1IRR9_SYNKA|nr:hypothetical protein SKAU_G00259260 [Synaphobranchus kaupii]